MKGSQHVASSSTPFSTFIQFPEICSTLNCLCSRSRSSHALVYLPCNAPGPQNSLVLLDRRRFLVDTAGDVTAQVLARIGGDWVAPGDLLAVSVSDSDGVSWLLASFHGDRQAPGVLRTAENKSCSAVF